MGVPSDRHLLPLVGLCHFSWRACRNLLPMKFRLANVEPNEARPAFASVMQCGSHRATRLVVIQRGFTMIELLIVIAIVAIVAVIAVPSLRGTLNDFRQKSAHGLLVSDLNQARGEAIKRNTRVLVCVRNTAGTGCAVSTNWLAGWVACTDADGDGTCDTSTATNPNPFIVRPALNAALTLTVLDASASAISSLRFNANSSQGGGSSSVTLALGGTWSGSTARTITVAGTGNISRQ